MFAECICCALTGPLLALYERQKELENLNSGAPLNLVLRCVVQKLNANADGNQVVSIQSSRGEVRCLLFHESSPDCLCKCSDATEFHRM